MRASIVKALVGLVVIAALVVSALPAFGGATFGVRATSNRWRPRHTYIARGDTVRWRNPSSRRHTIKAYGGNWSYFRRLPRGEARARRFFSFGTYRYRCTLHSTLSSGSCSGMCGIVHVVS
jgi:plastocyanin